MSIASLLPIGLSRSFARLLGLEIKGQGPFYVIEKDDETLNSSIASNLTARQVAEFLESYDLAQMRASGRCCPTGWHMLYAKKA